MTMAGETIEELRTRENNPFLKVISATELDKMLRLYHQSLSEPFREITEEDYYDLLDVLPPLRMRQKTRSLWVNRTTGACTLSASPVKEDTSRVCAPYKPHNQNWTVR